MDLKGKTSLVTGSTSGMGLGMAERLARAGANIVLNGFGEYAPAKAHVGSVGVTVGYHGADISMLTQTEAIMVYAEKEFGAERRDAIIAINLNSAFRTSRLALLGMKKQNGGRNVKVGSTHGLVASAGKSAQFAAKHGVVELTKAIALETASTGSRW